MDTTGWVGADKAAELLGITRKSVYDYALRLKGFPQPERVGRTVLWREDDLIAWRRDHPSRKKS